MKRFLTSTFVFCISLFSVIAQPICDSGVKGLYVNDFKLIVGNAAAEDDLLEFAQDSGFNYLILYNLYYIHNNLFDITTSSTSLPLSNFINKAKTMYGIESVAGVGETYDSFGNFHAYNQLHLGDPTRLIDVYNMEFEFWNSGTTAPGGYYCTSYLEPEGLTCDTANAFDFYLEELCRLDSLCDAHEYINSETYIGNPTEVQCTALSGCADRVLVHYYRPSDVYVDGSSIYNYKADRLPALAAAAELSRVMPIFACTEEFMGEWLLTNPHDKAFDTWLNGTDGYNDDVGAWKANTSVEGQVWYRYTCLNPDPILTGIDEEKEGDELLIYPNPATNRLTVEFDGIVKNIEVVDLMGSVILVPINSQSKTKTVINVSSLQFGTYWLRSESFSGSFVVE